MGGQRPFRFGVIGFGDRSRTAWVAQARRAEALGYATFSVGEHLITDLDAITAATAATMATSTIRIGSLSLANDLHNPVMLARAVASLDVLSDGRFEFGLGSGFYRTDYDGTGIPFDPPATRIDRLAEAVRLIKEAFGGDRIDHDGVHYSVHGLTLTPTPLQQPGPPLLIGGGGRHVLELAAREADSVSINIRSSPEGGFDWSSMTAEATAQKVRWVRAAAGERVTDLEVHWLVQGGATITADPIGVAREKLDQFGALGAISPEALLACPQVLIGTDEEAIVEKIHRNREEYGVSYLTVFASAMEAFAPIAARLTGR